jgi:hypothetical protein
VTYRITVVTDPNMHSLHVTWYGKTMVSPHYLVGSGPAVVQTQSGRPGLPPPAVSVADLTGPPASTPLCRALVQAG